MPAAPRNRLLRALPPDDLALLRPHLDPVRLQRGDVVIRPGEPMEHVYFPEDGLASVISHAGAGESRRAEVGLFGLEGMAGTALVLGVDRTPHETFVQVDGTWLRVGADALAEAMRRGTALRGLLMRYVQTFLLTLGQTALANGTHTTQERLARWLLMCHDRLDGDDLPLTHDLLSLMLAAHRPGVTVAVHALEGARMIRARRGVITVLDRGKLRQVAGGTYGVAEAEYERLIGPFKTHPDDAAA